MRGSLPATPTKNLMLWDELSAGACGDLYPTNSEAAAGYEPAAADGRAGVAARAGQAAPRHLPRDPETLHEQLERQRRLAVARVDSHDGTTNPFLGEPVIVALDAWVSGAALSSDGEQAQCAACRGAAGVCSTA